MSYRQWYYVNNEAIQVWRLAVMWNTCRSRASVSWLNTKSVMKEEVKANLITNKSLQTQDTGPKKAQCWPITEILGRHFRHVFRFHWASFVTFRSKTQLAGKVGSALGWCMSLCFNFQLNMLNGM